MLQSTTTLLKACHSLSQAVMGEFHGALPPAQLENVALQFEQWKYAW